MALLVGGIMEPEYCVCILRDAYVMAMMDHKAEHSEQVPLERLADVLGLS